MFLFQVMKSNESPNKAQINEITRLEIQARQLSGQAHSMRKLGLAGSGEKALVIESLNSTADSLARMRKELEKSPNALTITGDLRKIGAALDGVKAQLDNIDGMMFASVRISGKIEDLKTSEVGLRRQVNSLNKYVNDENEKTKGEQSKTGNVFVAQPEKTEKKVVKSDNSAAGSKQKKKGVTVQTIGSKSDYEFWYEKGFGAEEKDSAKWKENYAWAKVIVDAWKTDEKKMPALFKGMDENLLTSLVAYAKSMEGDFLDLSVGAKQAQAYLGKAIETMKANNWLAADWKPENGFSKEEATVLLTLVPLVYRNRVDDLVSKTRSMDVADVATYIYDADAKKSQFAIDSFKGTRSLYTKQCELNAQRAEIIAGMGQKKETPVDNSAPATLQEQYSNLDEFANHPFVKASMEVLQIQQKGGKWEEADFADYLVDGKYDVNAILKAAQNVPEKEQAVTTQNEGALSAAANVSAITTALGQRKGGVKDALVAGGVVDSDGALTATYMEYLKNSSMSEKEQNKWASKIESSLKKDKLNDHTSYILMQKLQENLKASGVTAEDNKLGLHQMTADNVAGIDGESLAKSLVKADLSLFAPGKISEDRSQMLKNMKSGLAEMGAYAHVTAKSQETTVKVEGQFATLGELLIYDAYLPGKARKDGEPVTNNLLYNITYDADGKERTPEEASKLYEQAKNGKDAATDAYTQKSVNDALNPAAPVKDAQATGSVTLDVENVSASVAVTVELKSQVEWVNDLFKDQAAIDYFNKIPNVDIQVPMSDGTTGPMNARAAVLEVIEQTAANEDVTAFGGQDMPIKDAYKLLMENKGGKALLEAACTQLGITVPQ